MRGRPDIYLVIKNEKIMTMFIKLLVYKMRTIDGYKNSMNKYVDNLIALKLQKKPNMSYYQQYEMRINIENKLVKKVAYQYQLIKIRYKMSFIAFIENKTFSELILSQIKKSYKVMIKTG